MKIGVNTCIVGIGSNINPENNIQKMLAILGGKVKIIKLSSFIQTKPIGIDNQPDFTNGAVKIETPLSQEKLKHLLVSIEDELGRDRLAPKFGSRTMDLDIIIWNGNVVDQDYYTREFLKKSVQEIN
jgi:2-amino-4-hydroxy-6-hydroxymethyldihydropteridine diphosphokinase